MSDFFSVLACGIIGAIVISSLYFGYKLLKKTESELDGYEIILHQLSFILLFHIGSYTLDNDGLFNFSMIIGLFGVIFLAIYYLIRLIIRRKYISIKTFGLYAVAAIINIASMYFMVRGGWDVLYYFIVGVCELFVIGYLLVINLITLIVNTINKNIIEIKTFNFNRQLKRQIICIGIVCPLVYGFIGNVIYDYRENYYKKMSSEYVLEYLNDKYGDYEFEVSKIEETESCGFMSCDKVIYNYDVYVNSKFDEEFVIVVDINDKEIVEDYFMYQIASDFLGEDIDSEYYLFKYLKQAYIDSINENILGQYDATVEFKSISVDENIFYDLDFSKIDDISDMYDCFSAKTPTITVNKEFTSEQLNEFNLYILEVYNKLDGLYDVDSGNNIVHFNFNYKNPFNSVSKHYDDGGYIRETNVNYLIYTDASPYTIDK